MRNIFEIIGYIACSKHRKNVLRTLLKADKTPAQITAELQANRRAVTKALRELDNAGAVVCVDVGKRRNRRYHVTDIGSKAMIALDNRNLEIE